jgi:hypothetical protein
MAPPSPRGFQPPPKARERRENGRLKPNLELYEAKHFLSRERSHLKVKLRIHEMLAAIIKQLATVNFQVQNLTPHLIPPGFSAAVEPESFRHIRMVIAFLSFPRDPVDKADAF